MIGVDSGVEDRDIDRERIVRTVDLGRRVRERSDSLDARRHRLRGQVRFGIRHDACDSAGCQETLHLPWRQVTSKTVQHALVHYVRLCPDSLGEFESPVPPHRREVARCRLLRGNHDVPCRWAIRARRSDGCSEELECERETREQLDERPCHRSLLDRFPALCAF
ncbi:hypothetical protein HRbin27_01715 [bacterium HR27]|nr:hypothetical protein HRbin27_01715 [bacterium HR27]